MNKYTARGLAEAANEGHKILVVTDGQIEARRTAHFISENTKAWEKLSLVNGQDRITWASGGSIDVQSLHRGGYKGMGADVVYVDITDHELLARPGVVASLTDCVAPGNNSGIVFP